MKSQSFSGERTKYLGWRGHSANGSAHFRNEKHSSGLQPSTSRRGLYIVAVLVAVVCAAILGAALAAVLQLVV
jgi:hypothetical protein